MLARPVDDVLFSGLATRFGAQHHHGFHGFAAIGVARADDAGFLHQRAFEEQQFDFAGPDFEAAGVDHAFQAVGNEKVALFVAPAEVTGAEESFAVDGDEGCFRRLGVAPVAAKDHRAVGHDLTDPTDGKFDLSLGVDDAAVDAVDRDAQALQLGAFGRVAVAWRGGLGQAVTFRESEAEFLLQPFGHCLRHGGTATREVAQAGQVEALVVGAAEEVDDHRGNAGPVRHPVARDQPSRQVAVPTRHDDDGAAEVD